MSHDIIKPHIFFSFSNFHEFLSILIHLLQLTQFRLQLGNVVTLIRGLRPLGLTDDVQTASIRISKYIDINFVVCIMQCTCMYNQPLASQAVLQEHEFGWSSQTTEEEEMNHTCTCVHVQCTHLYMYKLVLHVHVHNILYLYVV